MNEEILAGLKIAKERGFSPEDAAKSFINAGYNVSEVREASAFLLKGFSPLPTVTKEGSVSKVAPAILLEEKKEMSNKTKWIIFTVVALIVVTILMSLLLFKEQFLSVVDSISP